MIYLIPQVLLLLAIASLLSAALGWFLRWRRAQKTEVALRKRMGLSEQALPGIRNALADANDELDRQETELIAMRNRLKEHQLATKEKTLAVIKRHAGALTDVMGQLRSRDKLLADAMQVAGEQSERITELEEILSNERELQGRDQLARIIELEALLVAEREAVERFSQFDDIRETTVTSNVSRIDQFDITKEMKRGSRGR